MNSPPRVGSFARTAALPELRLPPRWTRWARWLVAARHPLLVGVAWGSTWSSRDDLDWGLLSLGARHLFSLAPLSAYAKTPGLQAGPPSLVLVRGLDALPRSCGIWVTHILMACVGWLMLYLVERWTVAAVTWRSAPVGEGLLTLVVGVPVLLMWSSLSGGTTHVEDSLAILFGLLAMRAISSGHEDRGALLVGLAIAWKPWAIVALPLVLGCSRRPRAALIAIAIPAVCWLPFVIGDHATLSAVSRYFELEPNSPLRAVGLSGRHVPRWWRSVELPAALLAATAAAVARRDWRVAFAAGCAMRLLLDPAGFQYYFAGLIMITALTERMIGSHPLRTGVIWLTAGYLVNLVPSGVSDFVLFAGLLAVWVSWIWPQRRPAAAQRLVPVQRAELAAVRSSAVAPDAQVASLPPL